MLESTQRGVWGQIGRVVLRDEEMVGGKQFFTRVVLTEGSKK